MGNDSYYNRIVGTPYGYLGGERVVQVNSDNAPKEDVMRRLKKIEGQVKGLQRMVDQDKYCVDILIQIAAVRAAINKVGVLIVESHSRECLIRAVEENRQDESVDELVSVLAKFMK